VAGVHELLGNALVMTGEKPRTTDLRGEPLPAPAGTSDPRPRTPDSGLRTSDDKKRNE